MYFPSKILKPIFLFLCVIGSLSTYSQIQNPTSWSFAVNKPKAKAGDIVELIIKAKVKSGWHLYSNGYVLDPGPLPTVFEFDKNGDFEAIGTAKAIGDATKYDDIFEGNVKYFKGNGEFRQKIKLVKDNAKISGAYSGQVCTDTDGNCVPVAGKFKLIIASEKTVETSNTAGIITPPVSNQIIDSAGVPIDSVEAATPTTQKITSLAKTENEPEQESLWSFFITAFLGGLVALLTPCVYPIIPMTVSFFTKQKNGVGQALLYGFFIVLIYVLFGTIIAYAFGEAAPNFMSTHWVPNLIFFLVFTVFGLSFLGLFEITLPSSLVNKMDANADRGGILGVFFMAFTLVLVSFSCTGPIAGTILGLGAQGQVIKPIIGMLGFGLAFGIPFTFFALFPSYLQSLPKSGGWLNVIKVVLGFAELALALKFLSTIDLTLHWGILDREIYLAIWIAISVLTGLYLIGKIILPHDSPTEKVSVPRLIFAIAAFSFAVYLVPGMWGAPLKALSGWLPPMSTFSAFGANGGENKNVNASKKYGDMLHLPHNLEGFFDYNEALAYAKKVNKPLFIDFTGHGCVNCRKMEDKVWIEPKVYQILKEKYVIVALYVDEKAEKPEAEWYTSKVDGNIKKSIGQQNLDFEISKFKGNAQPYYCLVDPATETLLKKPLGYTPNSKEFFDYLN